MEFNSFVSCPGLLESSLQADNVEELLAGLEPLTTFEESSAFDADDTASTVLDLSDADELPLELLFADAELIDLQELPDELDGSLQPGAQTNSGGGNQGLAPLLVSGGADAIGYADYVFSADGSTFESSATWFINPPNSGSLTYSVQSSLSIVNVSINSVTGLLSITPTGTVGIGSFTVTATNDVGSRSVFVSVYCGRVIGYSLEERAYGGDWGAVDDSAADGSWDLLWQENEYRWTPIFESNQAPPSYKIQTVQASSRLLNSTGSYGTFASNSYSMYSSESGGSYVAPEPAWPYVIGVPSLCCECDVSLSVSIQGYHPSSSTEVFLGTNNVVLTLDKTRPTSVAPRIGVNRIQSVTWTAPNANIRLETYQENSSQMRCFPERPSENAEIANQVYATVSLAAEVPTGMSGTVYVDYFDPVNPLGTQEGIPTDEDEVPLSSTGKRDNHGTGTLSATTLSVTNASGMTLHTTLTINQAYAGDNYIAVAHPNNVVTQSYKITDDVSSSVQSSVLQRKDSTSEDGYSLLSESLQSPILTVWRTLWVEIDRMILDDDSEALSPIIGNFTTNAFAQACISVQV